MGGFCVFRCRNAENVFFLIQDWQLSSTASDESSILAESGSTACFISRCETDDDARISFWTTEVGRGSFDLRTEHENISGIGLKCTASIGNGYVWKFDRAARGFHCVHRSNKYHAECQHSNSCRRLHGHIFTARRYHM